MVKAIWTGSYPNLCSGKWFLLVNDEDVSEYIPDDLRESPMNTKGEYQSWHFENWEEVFESYVNGMECSEWIVKNKYWLDTISTDINIQTEIFDAINAADWRHGSCGGCI